MDRMTLDSVYKAIDYVQSRFDSPENMHLYGAVALVRDEIRKMTVEMGFGDTDLRHNLTSTERALCSQGKRIDAIKELRNRTGVSLREAKDLVDYWYPKPHESAYKRLQF